MTTQLHRVASETTVFTRDPRFRREVAAGGQQHRTGGGIGDRESEGLARRDPSRERLIQARPAVRVVRPEAQSERPVAGTDGFEEISPVRRRVDDEGLGGLLRRCLSDRVPPGQIESITGTGYV